MRTAHRLREITNSEDEQIALKAIVGAGMDILHIGSTIEGFSGASDIDIDDFLRIVLDGGQTKLQMMEVDGEKTGSPS